MELLLDIILGLAVVGIVYEYTRLLKGYRNLVEVFIDSEEEYFYNEKELQKTIEELKLEIESLKTESEKQTLEVTPKPTRKRSVSKKIPNVE